MLVTTTTRKSTCSSRKATSIASHIDFEFHVSSTPRTTRKTSTTKHFFKQFEWIKSLSTSSLKCKMLMSTSTSSEITSSKARLFGIHSLFVHV